VTPEELTGKKTVILSHFATTGACEEMRDWLLGLRASEVVYIAFPFGAGRGRRIRVTVSKHGVMDRECVSWFKWSLPEPLAYAKDFFYALLYVFRYGRGADVLVAGDNLLAAAGCLMRRVARVRCLIYYMIDYTPVRYTNGVLNAVYYAVDRFAAYHVDVVWPLTASIIKGRFDANRLQEDKVRWYPVPYGSHPCDTKGSLVWNLSRVVYMGDVVRNKGAELLVPMAMALKRLVPKASFTIIGGGRDLPLLREEVRKSGLDGCFDICGFVERFEDVIARIVTAGVAIAPYYPFDANSFTFFSDPGKIKVYLGCGVPVVLTDVPPIAKTLQREQAGVIAEYNAEDFARKIAALMFSAEYLHLRDKACRLGESFAWPVVLADAFAKLDASHKG